MVRGLGWTLQMMAISYFVNGVLYYSVAVIRLLHYCGFSFRLTSSSFWNTFLRCYTCSVIDMDIHFVCPISAIASALLTFAFLLSDWATWQRAVPWSLSFLGTNALPFCFFPSRLLLSWITDLAHSGVCYNTCILPTVSSFTSCCRLTGTLFHNMDSGTALVSIVDAICCTPSLRSSTLALNWTACIGTLDNAGRPS